MREVHVKRHQSQVWHVIVHFSLHTVWRVVVSSSSPSNKTPVLVFRRSQVCPVPFRSLPRELGGVSTPLMSPLFNQTLVRGRPSAARSLLLWPSRGSTSAATGSSSPSVNESVRQFSNTFTSKTKTHNNNNNSDTHTQIK